MAPLGSVTRISKTASAFADAIITSYVVDYDAETFSGCVYDRAGRLIRSAQRMAKHAAFQPTDPDSICPTQDIDLVGGRSVYLGHFSSHYGHFLLETLSRFWAVDMDVYDQVVFLPFFIGTEPISTYAPASVCLDCFGIRQDQVRVVDHTTRFANLIVPTALVELTNSANEEQAFVYQKIAAYCERNASVGAQYPSRIYLSRSGLRRNQYAVLNEDKIEDLFISSGFALVHPENISFKEQVRMYSRADVVAGLSGSALHNTVFMKPDASVIEIGTLKQQLRMNVRRNQAICNGLSKVRSVFIPFKGSIVDDRMNTVNFDLRFLAGELEKSNR